MLHRRAASSCIGSDGITIGLINLLRLRHIFLGWVMEVWIRLKCNGWRINALGSFFRPSKYPIQNSSLLPFSRLSLAVGQTPRRTKGGVLAIHIQIAGEIFLPPLWRLFCITP